MSENAFDQALSAQAILLDWDGCVVENGSLKPGSQAFLRAFGDKISILSNNSTDPPAALARKLDRAGAPIPEDRIHLAGHVALEVAAQLYGKTPIYLLANAMMTRLGARIGLNIAAADAAAVVLLRDTGFTFRKLEAAVQQLRRGAQLLIANPDLTHPKGETVAPETGALLAAICACVDLAEVDTTIVGKPSRRLFEHALAVAQVRPENALMLGDNPATDIAGAQQLGIPACLIGGSTGLTLETIMADPRAGRLAA